MVKGMVECPVAKKFGGIIQISIISKFVRSSLDLQHSFVSYHQSYLLYFWHMEEKYDLITTSIQRLSMEVSARNGSDGVPVVVNASSPGDINWSLGVESLVSSKK